MNRTIIEINHDWAPKLAADNAAAGAALAYALRHPESEAAWQTLAGFGMKRIATIGERDERTLYINGRAVDAMNGKDRT